MVVYIRYLYCILRRSNCNCAYLQYSQYLQYLQTKVEYNIVSYCTRQAHAATGELQDLVPQARIIDFGTPRSGLRVKPAGGPCEVRQ